MIDRGTRVVQLAFSVCAAAAFAACGPSTEPEAPIATADPEPTPGVTATAEVTASAAVTEPGLPAAVAAFAKSCEEGNADDCYDLGGAYFEGEVVAKDEPKMYQAFRRACELGHMGGCYNTGAALFHGNGTKEDKPAAIPFFEKSCGAGHKDGCFNLAVVYLKGEGAAVDERKGNDYLKKACDAKHEKACELAKQNDSKGIPGANVSIGSMTADGLTVKDMSCRTSGAGGLLGGLAGPTVIVASLAKKKAALDKCAPQGAEPRVRWTFAGGKVTKVEVEAPTPAIKTCVENAVKGTTPGQDGECAATVVIGKTP